MRDQWSHSWRLIKNKKSSKFLHFLGINLQSISKFISKTSEYRLNDRQESKVHRLKLLIINNNGQVTNRQNFAVCRWSKREEKKTKNSFAFHYCWLLLINMLQNVCAINSVQHCSLLTVHWLSSHVHLNPNIHWILKLKNLEHELNEANVIRLLISMNENKIE